MASSNSFADGNLSCACGTIKLNFQLHSVEVLLFTFLLILLLQQHHDRSVRVLETDNGAFREDEDNW